MGSDVENRDRRPAGEAPTRVDVYPGKEAVVDFDPTLTFECVDSCTWCCHHGVLLYESDLRELAAREDLAPATSEHDGERFLGREPKDRAEHVDVDGEACYFLREDGLCALHADHDWKPTRCSVFPLHVTAEDGDLHVDVREDARTYCEGLNVSERTVIDHLDAFLPELLWDLPDPDTDPEPGP